MRTIPLKHWNKEKGRYDGTEWNEILNRNKHRTRANKQQQNEIHYFLQPFIDVGLLYLIVFITYMSCFCPVCKVKLPSVFNDLLQQQKITHRFTQISNFDKQLQTMGNWSKHFSPILLGLLYIAPPFHFRLSSYQCD